MGLWPVSGAAVKVHMSELLTCKIHYCSAYVVGKGLHFEIRSTSDLRTTGSTFKFKKLGQKIIVYAQ